MENKKCWGSPLGNCSDTISGEHIVSRGIIPTDIVRVKGMRWCKDDFKNIGISSLTRKNLCEHHNSITSPLDQEGKKFREIIESINEDFKRFKGVKSNWLKPKYFTVNGNLIERLFLKLTINICYDESNPIGLDSSEVGKPSLDIIEYVFGVKSIKYPKGLYIFEPNNKSISTKEHFNFVPVKYNSFITGGLFKFRGFQFLIHFGEKEPSRIEKIRYDVDKEFGGKIKTYHLERINFKKKENLFRRIRFKW